MFFGWVTVRCAMVQAKCLHLIVSLFLNSLTMGTAAKVVASDILVGAQPRIRCWARTRSSSSDLVDTATARRQQRVEDAARVGLQFPCRPKRRGRGVPSVAMKWRDAVEAATVHGPLPLDVTLDAPYWWQPGMPLLPPADHRAPVPLKRKRVTSAEPKTDPAKRAYMRIPDEAKLWLVDFHAYQARVSMASHSPTTFALRSIWCWSFSGPRHPIRSADGMTAAHLTSAADHPWSCHHSPFRVSRTSHMPSRAGSASPLGSTSTAVCCASSTSYSSPADDGRGSFCAACSYHGSLRRLAPATGRARLTLPESVNFCSCVRSLQNLTGSHLEPGRDSCAHRPIRRAWVDHESRVSPCLRLARLRHGHARCEHEGGM